METKCRFDILPQPDDYTCGPTCLQAVYTYYGAALPLARVIAEVPRLPDGGTLAVLLACHALHHGFTATIYTYNLQIFDPTWFLAGSPPLAESLKAQMVHKNESKLHAASVAYLEFLAGGGHVRFRDLTPALIWYYLRRSIPILTGLSATYLYREARAWAADDEPDDIRGTPVGHFVVLCGYDPKTRRVLIADPLQPNPVASTPRYAVGVDRVICAILLGILTYDANLLIIQPRSTRSRGEHAHFYRCQ